MASSNDGDYDYDQGDYDQGEDDQGEDKNGYPNIASSDRGDYEDDGFNAATSDRDEADGFNGASSELPEYYTEGT